MMRKYRSFKPKLALPAVGQGRIGVGIYFTGGLSTKKDIETGIDLGMNLLDTAEVYGKDFSGQLIGKIISRCRDKAIDATKFSQENSSFQNVIRSTEASLHSFQAKINL